MCDPDLRVFPQKSRDPSIDLPPALPQFDRFQLAVRSPADRVSKTQIIRCHLRLSSLPYSNLTQATSQTDFFSEVGNSFLFNLQELSGETQVDEGC